ncbi:MAG: trypsin-like peptidase domain-containing protein [Defluviitaleaceae bacterium]|nr:trypsin-like peptidase domain-containing protein [Defluviitaleaceae bacterium]
MKRYEDESFDEQLNEYDVVLQEDFWEDERLDKADKRKAGGRLFLAVAVVLIVTFVGAPLLGAGLGFGSQIATNYMLPRLLDDSAAREGFAFDNVHTPLSPLAVRNLDGDTPLVGRKDYVALVEAVKPSVVTLSVVMPSDASVRAGETRSRAGTGILMYETASRYYIATNAHVIAGGVEVYASIEGSAPIATIPIGRDDAEDLAVIAVEKGEAVRAGVTSVTLARFGDSHAAQVGEIVVAIGNAMGEGIAVTNGIVSAKDVEIYVDGMFLDVLQTNAAINRGNSGGPLVNVFGEVIGINTAKFNEQVAEAMGYAIPSNVAKPILERIMHEGPEAPRPRIGINGDTWTARDAQNFVTTLTRRGHNPQTLMVPQSGALVTLVGMGGPAYQAGMQRNDIIVAVGGVTIDNFDDLISNMGTRREGDIVVFTVIRGGLERIDIPITLGEPIMPSF